MACISAFTSLSVFCSLLCKALVLILLLHEFSKSFYCFRSLFVKYSQNELWFCQSIGIFPAFIICLNTAPAVVSAVITFFALTGFLCIYLGSKKNMRPCKFSILAQFNAVLKRKIACSAVNDRYNSANYISPRIVWA